MTYCVKEELADGDKDEEEFVRHNHRIQSLVLLLYLVLLILSVLTTWLFKHRRFRFVHETGLSVIYGLIAGIIIKSSMDVTHVDNISMNLVATFNSTCEHKLPPQRIYLNVTVEGNEQVTAQLSESLFYTYAFVPQKYSGNKGEGRESDLEQKLTFDSEIFFNILLPPIIFTAGYSMKRKHFFRNFGAIVTFAFVGTFFASMVTGVICYGFSRIFDTLQVLKFSDCLLFGAMISATDPVTVLAIFNDLSVDVTLYALVFGEAVLNDAVAIVLAESIETYKDNAQGINAIAQAVGTFAAVFCGAFGIGISTGVLTAVMTKFTHVRDHPLLETALFTLMSYSTFLLSEFLGFTGIVAVLFCGITQAHYTYNNLSEESQIWTKEFFELLNFLAENFVFAYIGVTVFTFQRHNWHPGFIACALVSILVARAINVYPLSFILNFGRKDAITMNKQHMLMFSGLRGAMAFSLAIRNVSTFSRQLFLSTTLVIVMVTVVFCGGLTTHVLQLLKIKVNVNSGSNARPRVDSDISTASGNLPIPTQEETENYQIDSDLTEFAVQPEHDARPKSFVARLWGNFDNNFVKPVLTHSGPLLSETLPTWCLPLASLLTSEEQLIRCTTAAPPRRDSGDPGEVMTSVSKHSKPSRSGFSYQRSSLVGDDSQGYTGFANDSDDLSAYSPNNNASLVLDVPAVLPLSVSSTAPQSE